MSIKRAIKFELIFMNIKVSFYVTLVSQIVYLRKVFIEQFIEELHNVSETNVSDRCLLMKESAIINFCNMILKL